MAKQLLSKTKLPFPTETLVRRMSPMAAPAVPARTGVVDGAGRPILSRLCRSAIPDAAQVPVALCGNTLGNGPGTGPMPGDVALFEVVELGRSSSLLAADGRRCPLGRGDRFVGVFGNHHDGDALEARVQGTERLSLLNELGLVGTVCCRQVLARGPTTVRFRGFAAGDGGGRVNVRRSLCQPLCQPQGQVRAVPALRNTYLAVGCAWGTGRASAVVRLCHDLLGRDLRVAVCRLTGGDGRAGRPAELPASVTYRDFAGFGLPSTYLLRRHELRALFLALTGELAASRPDVVLMELGDAVLQRETSLVLADPFIRKRVRGLILTAACAGSALFGLAWARSRGHRVVALSGVLESAPLLSRVVSQQAKVPVGSLGGTGRRLADVLLDDLVAEGGRPPSR